MQNWRKEQLPLFHFKILTKRTLKTSLHKQVEREHQLEIIKVKEVVSRSLNKLILHFDFAENWRKVTKQEIQSAYWKSEQLSIFTVV